MLVVLITLVGVSVLALLFLGILTGQTYELTEDKIEAIGANTETETLTVLNSTAVAMGHPDIQESTISVLNGSDAVGAGNFSYSLTTSASTVTLLNNDYNNTGLVFSYTWGRLAIRTSVKNGIISAFEGLETVGDYLPIIVLALIIFFVLALVIGFTLFAPGQGSGKAL